VDKRERLPKDELLNAIFVLFQTNQFFTLKELIDKTQQPQIWLKEVLNEVCDFHKRGPNVQKYELKAEYKSNNAIIGHEVSGQGS
jgi:transcription initiation factor TFIIF subunit beta